MLFSIDLEGMKGKITSRALDLQNSSTLKNLGLLEIQPSDYKSEW